LFFIEATGRPILTFKLLAGSVASKSKRVKAKMNVHHVLVHTL